MIVCRKCKASNQDGDAFCGNCGAFLEWTGERIGPEPVPVPEAELPGEPLGRVGLFERIKGAVDLVVSPGAGREDSGREWAGYGKDPVGGPATPGGPPGAPAAGGAPRPAGAAPPPPGVVPPPPPGVVPPRPPGVVPPRPPGVVPPPPGVVPPPPPPPHPPAPSPPGAAPSSGAGVSPPTLAPRPPIPVSTSPTEGPDAGVLPTRPLASGDTAKLVVSVEGEATARPDEPGEVVPQRVTSRVAPVVKTKPTRRLQPGDLICGQCGEGNPPTRKFCSRCGDELTTAQVVRRRWWRRLLFWRRGPRTLDAGTRPGQKGARKGLRPRVVRAYRKVRAWIAAVLVAATLVYVLVPALREPVNRYFGHPVGKAKTEVLELWHKITNPYDDVPVKTSRATSQLRADPGSNAFDGNIATFWAARWNQKSPPTLVVTFDQPETIAAIVVHNGASQDQADKFLQPQQLRLKYGNGDTEDLTLQFSGDAQTIKLGRATTVGLIRFTVNGVYAKKDLTSVAISEIEFKTKK